MPLCPSSVLRVRHRSPISASLVFSKGIKQPRTITEDFCPWTTLAASCPFPDPSLGGGLGPPIPTGSRLSLPPGRLGACRLFRTAASWHTKGGLLDPRPSLSSPGRACPSGTRRGRGSPSGSCGRLARRGPGIAPAELPGRTTLPPQPSGGAVGAWDGLSRPPSPGRRSCREGEGRSFGSAVSSTSP